MGLEKARRPSLATKAIDRKFAAKGSERRRWSGVNKVYCGGGKGKIGSGANSGSGAGRGERVLVLDRERGSTYDGWGMKKAGGG